MPVNGTVIDPVNCPFTFTVGSGRTIKGWDLIVSKMRVSDRFTVRSPLGSKQSKLPS